MTVQQISRHAKRTRKPGEKWLAAIKRSARELKGTKTKSAPKKRRKVGATKKKAAKKRTGFYQTGKSSRIADQRQKAKKPGKRKSRSGATYYERRKNRSDMPGSLTGIKSQVRLIAENELAQGLLAREKATTLKQHKAAMSRISKARKALKAFD